MANTIEQPCTETTADATRVELTPQRLTALGVLSSSQVDRIVSEETRTQFLIEDFLPAKAIAILAGDSSIGKSPLVLQLALAVAAGVPFCGMATTQGRVLYFDLENPLSDCKEMRDALVRFLGLREVPPDLLLVTEPKHDLEHLISEVRPKLVIIDSVRSFRPEVTETNRNAGEWLKQIRKLARQYGCAFVLIHHLRKPDRKNGVPDLDSSSAANWLLEMEGPRAFVNQTDVRVAVARGTCNDAALEIKWSRRVHGDSPLMLLDRIHDGNGDPLGYRHLTGAALLSTERQSALGKLSAGFSFGQAQHALGKSADPTNKFLHECIRLGVVEKVGRGLYRKLPVE